MFSLLDCVSSIGWHQHPLLSLSSRTARTEAGHAPLSLLVELTVQALLYTSG
jgi:hypothetical protein